jgi:tRNA(Arg) A34 adenosine deaminase TadA
LIVSADAALAVPWHVVRLLKESVYMSNHPKLTVVESEMLMRFALAEAEHALDKDALPGGAVVVMPGEHGLRILGRGREDHSYPHTHSVCAALVASRGRVRPGESGLVVVTTVEPCDNCYRACEEAGVVELIYALARPALGGLAAARGEGLSSVVPGVLATDARRLMYTFLERGRGERADLVLAEELVHRALGRSRAA